MSFTPETALEYLRRAHEQGRLAHGYLISGEAGSGKRAVAAGLTSLVTGLRPDAVFSSSAAGEVQVIEPASKSRRIVIEQVRELEHSLRTRATGRARKVGIIVDSDRLQPQAANAFLKTLEEPPDDSLLLLLSAIPEALPDTIISRCLSLHLAVKTAPALSPEQTELIELLGCTVDDERSQVQCAFAMAQGLHALLARIRERIQDEHAAALKREETRYRNTTDGAWLEGREDYYKALTESIYLQQRARLVDTLYLWWAEVLRASIAVVPSELPAARRQTEKFASKLGSAEILRRLRQIEELRDYLGRNIHETLALEAIFLSVFAR